MLKQRLPFSLFLFTYYGHAGAFATYASLLFAARGMSAPQIGILMSLIPVSRIIGPNLWGWVADHTEQRVLVLRATAGAAMLAFSAFFFVDSFLGFFCAMFVLNLFTSAQTPLCEALMLSEMRGDISGYGRIRMWGSAGFIAAVVLVGFALEKAGIDALPWLAGAMLVLTLASSLRIREAPPAEHKAAPRLVDVLRQPAVIYFFCSAALSVGAHMALYAYYSLYLELHGYSKTVIGLMWSLGVLCEIVFFYYQAALFKRFGAPRIMLCAFGVAALRFTVIGAGAEWAWVLVAAQMLHALSFAAHHSACIASLQQWFHGPLQARGQALFISIAYGLGGTLGGLFMSLCWKQFGPQAVYYAAAALALLGAWCAARSQAILLATSA